MSGFESLCLVNSPTLPPVTTWSGYPADEIREAIAMGATDTTDPESSEIKKRLEENGADSTTVTSSFEVKPQHDDEGEAEQAESDEEGEEEDEEPRLKYASLTKSISSLYRHGDATSSFLAAGDKMVCRLLMEREGIS